MAPPKSDNHNNSNYSDVPPTTLLGDQMDMAEKGVRDKKKKEFDGNSNQSVGSRTGKGGWNNCNHAVGAGAVPLYRPSPTPTHPDL
jgi:hypothetical protein